MQDHKGNSQPDIDREEHATISGVDGKKVFVLDNIGNQITSFSNATVTLVGLATLAPSPNFVGIMTVANPVTSFLGNVTLDAGSRTGIVGNVTLSDPKGFIGLVTATGSLSFGGNVTLNPSPNFIGLATVVASTIGSYSYLNMASNTTITAKSGSGLLHTLVINTRGTGSNCIVYDSLLPSGTKIATIDTTLSTTAFVYDISFATGLTFAMAGAGAADLTASYK